MASNLRLWLNAVGAAILVLPFLFMVGGALMGNANARATLWRVPVVWAVDFVAFVAWVSFLR